MIKTEIIMKRDMDLIREMLLICEKYEHGFAPPIVIEGHTTEEIGYHAFLLGEAGLAEISVKTHSLSQSPEATTTRLTWAGHEFLDASRDDKIWNQAKETLGDRFLSIPIHLLQIVLEHIILKQIGL